MIHLSYYREFIKAWGKYIIVNDIRTVAEFVDCIKKETNVSVFTRERLVTYDLWSETGIVDYEHMQIALDSFWIGIELKFNKK